MIGAILGQAWAFMLDARGVAPVFEMAVYLAIGIVLLIPATSVLML